MRKPLRKLLVGGAAVAALSAVAVLPASAYQDAGWFFQYSECAAKRDQIIDGQTGAECVWIEPEHRWHLYVYG
jgi:hypothetical protein